jgi:hypothetical protein
VAGGPQSRSGRWVGGVGYDVALAGNQTPIRYRFYEVRRFEHGSASRCSWVQRAPCPVLAHLTVGGGARGGRLRPVPCVPVGAVACFRYMYRHYSGSGNCVLFLKSHSSYVCHVTNCACKWSLEVQWVHSPCPTQCVCSIWGPVQGPVSHTASGSEVAL